MPARPDVATGQGRLLWVDVAKGACILLVVLHHAVVKDLALQAPPALQAVAAAWVWVSMALKPVRMPLFFVLSGLVAASAVRRPWADARRRVLSPYYLYVVWLVISLIGADYAAVRAKVGHPCNAVLLSAFLIATFWHAKLGLQVVIEDYVHTPLLTVASQLAVVFVCVLAALASVLAVIRIALGA